MRGSRLRGRRGAPTVQFIVQVGAQRLVRVPGRVHADHDRRGIGLSGRQEARRRKLELGTANIRRASVRERDIPMAVRSGTGRL